MLLVLAGIAAVTPSPSLVPSPSPSVVAIVHSAAPVVTHQSFWAALNQLAGGVSQTDLVMAAGIAVVALQYLLNHFKQLDKFVNQLVALALPFAALLPLSLLSDPRNLQYGPAIYVAGQFLYYVVEKIKTQGISTPAPTPADGLPRTATP